ncbi:hypothetical protein C883_3411 [Bacillus stratosphericus LAMA 585]|nr:hypothetical protein C883_3411 [Bacillus stratosphericus LAMA 585]
MASITIDCCPIAEHIMIFAEASICLISFNAVIPSISGIVISIVTRSGDVSLYFSTACAPFSASPTTSNPFFTRISLIIILMNAASSTINTLVAIYLFSPYMFVYFKLESLSD